MNRAMAKKNPGHKSILFWSIIALITLIFIGAVIYMFFDRQKEITNLDEMTHLREQQIFEQDGTYYVYVYSIIGVTSEKYELKKAENLEQSVLNYLSYANRNSDANKMYGMIVDSNAGTYGNYSCLVDGEDRDTSVNNVTAFENLIIHKDDIPILLKIENGKVKSSFLTENDIRKELQTAMGIE